MARPQRPAYNANNPAVTPIPVVSTQMPIVNTDDGTVTRSGQLLLEQLLAAGSQQAATGTGAAGPYIRTLVLYDLTPGAAIAPFVPIYQAGPGIRAIGVLRKTITANLVISINRNAETSPLFTFTLPASTPIHTDVVTDISTITFADLDVLIPGITASDSSTDVDGVATLTIEWVPSSATGSSGGGSGSGGFTASGDLAGTPTAQAVVGLQNIPLDAATVGTPTNGQVIEYDSASGRYKAVTLAGAGFTAGGDLSGTGTSQKVIGLESVPLDATTVGTPSNGQVITYDSASAKYKAVTPAAAPALPVVIGFVLNSGVTGTNVGPMLAAPHAGSVSKCVVAVKASDGSTALTFTINKNGASVFSSNPTIAGGAVSGSVSTFTSLTSTPLPVIASDVFSIDITSGTSSWIFTAQLE